MRFTAIVLSFSALVVAPTLRAQSAKTFDVASIRRNLSANQQGAGLAVGQPGGRFIAMGATLRRLVAAAYGDPQIDGGPAWMDTDRFDVNARAEGDPPVAEMVRMLQSLLADRFKLVLHRETSRPEAGTAWSRGCERADA